MSPIVQPQATYMIVIDYIGPFSRLSTGDGLHHLHRWLFVSRCVGNIHRYSVWIYCQRFLRKYSSWSIVWWKGLFLEHRLKGGTSIKLFSIHAPFLPIPMVYELIYSISTAQHCDRAIGINSCWLGKGPRINYGYASQTISLAIHL